MAGAPGPPWWAGDIALSLGLRACAAWCLVFAHGMGQTHPVSLEDIQQYTLQVESFHLCVPFSLTIRPDTMQACTGTSFILSSLCITTIERGLIKTPQFVLFYVLAVWLLFVCA